MSEARHKVETLNNLRNEMTHLWGSAFVLGGGVIAFLVLGDSVLEKILGLFALFMAISLANAYFLRYEEVKKITKELKEEK